MTMEATSDLWWKNAVVYCLDVETYLDADGDGCGDLAGLIERIDYLSGLGVTCLWLMPFYPTPGRDDGYDILDFYGVDPRLGTLGDFTELIRTARDRGLRVIADLVVNHTSVEHPWFQSARERRDSPFRDFYVWTDAPPEDGATDVVFPDKETSNWEYDETAGQYYLHRFYRHQPDLNVANPRVRDEIAKIVGFWLQQGLSGFRVDAVPFLIGTEGIAGADIAEDPHELIRDLRSFIGRRSGEAILMGEVNLPPDEQRAFFGDEGGDELNLLLNFILNQAMYLALARGQAAPIEDALSRLPAVPSDNGWGNFVRNHDELTLDKLSDAERQEVFAAFGPDEDMQLFGRGLRRRVPSMLGGDPRSIRMVYSLMFSLPGTPVLFYGEEIGMAENLDVEGRMSVRTPMQWSDGRNAGFSRAERSELRRPVVTGERFGPSGVNVADQRRDTRSLLNWMERLIRRRKECPEIGWGVRSPVETDEPSVLAHRCDWEGRTLIALHNLASEPVTTSFDVASDETLVDLFAAADVAPDGAGRVTVELEAFGFRWLRVRRER